MLETTFPDTTKDLSGLELKSILGSIITVQDPLPLDGLSHPIRLLADIVYSSLVGLHSILVVPESEESKSNIRIIHSTFAEFLINSDHCTNRSFIINSRQQHTEQLHGCLHVLQELWQDICNIWNSSLLNTEVPNLVKRRRKVILAHLKHACWHWCTHLVNKELLTKIFDALLEFVQKRLLYWVKACSLLGVLREAQRQQQQFQQQPQSIQGARHFSA